MKEIEEAVRREMEAACSMPMERSKSPHSYAQARTNVVMETVRAATMATTKKLERLALLQDQYKKKAEMVSKSAEQGLNMLVEKKPLVVEKKSNSSEAISMLNSSSSSINDSSSVATSNSQFLPKGASSPIMSHKKSKGYHDDFKKYKAPFMAPEKLQIVKPLEGQYLILYSIVYVAREGVRFLVYQLVIIIEYNYTIVGSVTLLKWKLLATPQLGGASSYFSNITHPGIHVKSWRGSPKNDKAVSHDNSSNNTSRTLGEEELGTSVDCTPSSSSTTAAEVAGYSPPTAVPSRHSDHSRTGIYNRMKATTSTTTTNTAASNSTVNITGMNDISALLSDNNNNNNNMTSDTLPHPTMVGSNVTGRLNPALKMGWLPGMRQPMATSDIGLASLVDDKVD